MEALTFKKILTEVLGEYGFKRKGISYLRVEDEVYCVVGLQKSNYINSYYINLGFFIKDIEPDFRAAKSTDGHIGTRFTNFGFGEPSRDFNLNLIEEENSDELKICFKRNVSDLIDGNLSIEGLRKLLIRYPMLKNRVRSIADEYFV